MDFERRNESSATVKKFLLVAQWCELKGEVGAFRSLVRYDTVQELLKYSQTHDII